MNNPMPGLLTSLLTREGTALVLPDPAAGIEGDGEAFAALVDQVEIPVEEGVEVPVLTAPLAGPLVPVLARTPEMPKLPEADEPVENVSETDDAILSSSPEVPPSAEVKAAPTDKADPVAKAEVDVPQPVVQTDVTPIVPPERQAASPSVAVPLAGASVAPTQREQKAPDKLRESPPADLVERAGSKAWTVPGVPERPDAAVPQDAVRTVAKPGQAPAKTAEIAKAVVIAAAPFIPETADPVKTSAPVQDPFDVKGQTMTARPSPPVHVAVTPRPSPPVATKPTEPTPRPTPPIETRPEAKPSDVAVSSVTPRPSPPFPMQAASVPVSEPLPLPPAQPQPDVKAKLVLVPSSTDPLKALSLPLANPLAASPAPVLVQAVAAPVATKVQPQSEPAKPEIDTNTEEIVVPDDPPEPLTTNVATSDPAPRATTAPVADPRVMPERMQAAEVIRQVDAAVTRSDNGTVEVSLNPKELGQVTIRIEGQQNDTRMTFTAERPETLQLLKSHQGDLQSALQASGFSQLDLSFADRSPGQSRQPMTTPAEVLAEQTEALPEPPRWENLTKSATSGRYDRRI